MFDHTVTQNNSYMSLWILAQLNLGLTMLLPLACLKKCSEKEGRVIDFWWPYASLLYANAMDQKSMYIRNWVVELKVKIVIITHPSQLVSRCRRHQKQLSFDSKQWALFIFSLRSFCVEFRELSHLTHDLYQAEMKWYFVTKIVLTYCQMKMF